MDINDLINLRYVPIDKREANTEVKPTYSIYAQITDKIGIEARNILNDKALKLNKSSIYIAEKSMNEPAILFSFLDTPELSLDLFKSIKTRKNKLLVPKLKLYYMPKIIREKLPSKGIVRSLLSEYGRINQSKKDYGIMTLVNNPNILTGKDSVMVDMSWYTQAIKSVTTDKKLRLVTNMRNGILEMYKKYITSFFPDVFKNKILYFRAPFLSDTKIALNIMESQMTTQLKPIVLFMKWFQDDPEGFKDWLEAFKITIVLEGANGANLVLSGNANYRKMSLFKPKVIMRHLHILDTVSGKIDPAKEAELNKDVQGDDADALTNLEDDDVMFDTDNPNEFIKDDQMEDIDKHQEIAEAFEKGSDDFDEKMTSKPRNVIMEENKDLEEDITEIELAELNHTTRSYNKDYYKILEDAKLSKEDKAVELVEEHNYSRLKDNAESKEIKNLRKQLVKRYGKQPKEMIDVIKKHNIKDSDLKIETTTDTSYNKSSTNNYDKSYRKELAKDDFENILAAPSNLTYPLMLKKYTKTDISDREFKGYELKIEYETHNGEPLEIVLDIPEAYNDSGNLFMGGSPKQIKLQNAAKPVIKQDENVIITTAYNKVMLSLSGKYISMADKITVMHINAYWRLTNRTPILKVKTTDELGYFIYNNLCSYHLIHLNKHFVGLISENFDIDFRGKGKDKATGLTVLGTWYGKQVLHDPVKDTVEVGGKTYNTIEFICSILQHENPEAWKKATPSSVTGAQLYTPIATIMGRDIPVVLVLLVAISLKDLLNMLRDTNKLEYKVIRNSEISDKFINNDKYGIIRLADYTIVMKYNNDLNSLLLNYLTTIDLSDKTVFDITNLMEEITGNSNTALYIENFADSFIDPITKRVCNLYNIPDDFVGLFIYAVSLFTTHTTVYKSDIRNYRLISPSETINRCIYDVISKELSNNAARVKRGSRPKVVIPRDAVIQRIQSLPNVNESNPVSAFREMMEQSQVSFKGHNGINEPRAYNNNVRMFNENNYGVETCATAYSGNAGIVKYMPFNPTVTNLSGDYEHHDSAEDLDSSSLMGFSDAYTPYTRFNHCARRLMLSGQFSHILPSAEADPMLVSCYADEAAVKMTPKHSFTADRPGKVTEVNKDFIVLTYDDKTVDVVSLNNIDRNSDKGYFLKNDFTPTKNIKPGYKFKAGEVIAVNAESYKVKSNGRFGLSAGALVWVLTTDGEGVWEDSTEPSEVLSRKLATRIVKRIARVIDLNTEIRDWNVDIGSDITPTDILFKYKVLTDDETINELFSNMEELSLKEVDAHYRGKIVDIRVYWRDARNVEMSKSIRQFIKAVDDVQRIKNNMAVMDKVTDQFTRKLYDKRPQRLTRDKFSKINGDTIENGQIMIEYHIEILDKLGTGDKIVLDNALKGEPSRIIPKELRYKGAETRRTCDLAYSTYSVVKRMTPGMIHHGQLLSVLLHIACKNRQILNRPAEPGTLLDYDSSEAIKKGKYKRRG